MQHALERLEDIYRGLPPVPCRGCGACCVTPHLTLVEFVHLLRGLLAGPGRNSLERLLRARMEPSPAYAGNFRCPLQDDARCMLHARRPLACRLEGLPVMDRMGFREERICPYITDADFPAPVGRAVVERAVDAVYALNGGFYPLLAEPYFLDALNLECWIAALADPALSQPVFRRVREAAAEVVDLSPLVAGYRDKTGFAVKIGLIDRFFAACGDGDYAGALRCMRAVVRDFPRTGGHFRRQGAEYLAFVERAARGDA